MELKEKNGAMENEFLQIYDELADAIFRHCYFRISDYERAKELVQETFKKVWEYIYRGKKVENLKAFVYRTANNLIIDEYRKKKAVSLDELLETGAEPFKVEARKTEIAAQMEELFRILEKLEEADRKIIIMKYLDGFSPREIGEIIKKSENAVSVQLNRSIKKLKKIYGI
ncbi:MAG: RNA polymerase sigma factor [Patescibacteria group bacterium]